MFSIVTGGGYMIMYSTCWNLSETKNCSERFLGVIADVDHVTSFVNIADIEEHMTLP